MKNNTVLVKIYNETFIPGLGKGPFLEPILINKETYMSLKQSNLFIEKVIEEEIKVNKEIINGEYLKFALVNSLPLDNAEIDTLYIVPNNDSNSDNLYSEYININNKWELIGYTSNIGGTGSGTSGDMFKSVYDKNNISKDVYSRSNHTGSQSINTIVGLQDQLNNFVNKSFNSYTQKANINGIDKILVDNTGLNYITVDQLLSNINDSHNKGYFITSDSLKSAYVTAKNGDFAIVGNTQSIWIWNNTSWEDIQNSGQVLSVNNKTGLITLTSSDIGLSNVTNNAQVKRTEMGTANGVATLDSNSKIKIEQLPDIINTNIENKVDKVAGKSLVNDTDIIKLNNLSGTNTGDETTETIKTKLGIVSETTDGYLTKTQYNNLINNSGSNTGTSMEKSIYDTNNNGIVDNAEKVNNHTVEKDVPSNAVFTDTIYSHPATHAPSIIAQDSSNRFVSDAEKTNWNNKASNVLATTTSDGLMSSADKVKLNNITEGSLSPISDLSSTTKSITLVNNQQYYFGSLTSLTVICSMNINSSLSFTSGTTPTTFTSASGGSYYKYIGDDCTGNLFTPVSNKRYIVAYSYDGINVLGVVGGYTL